MNWVFIGGVLLVGLVTGVLLVGMYYLALRDADVSQDEDDDDEEWW